MLFELELYDLSSLSRLLESKLSLDLSMFVFLLTLFNKALVDGWEVDE